MSALLERPAIKTVQRAPARRYTVEEFEQIYLSPENNERLFELIHGEIWEKMPTEEHGVIALNIGALLKAYVKQHKSGYVGVEIRHRVPTDRTNSRLPDIAYNIGQRPLIKKGSVPKMPDLAVEIQSPDDTIKSMREAATYYLANGTRLVWLVYPGKRLVEIYHADGRTESLTDTDALTGADVLPGFMMQVAEIFDE